MRKILKHIDTSINILILIVLLLLKAPITIEAQSITNYTFVPSSGSFTALSSPTNPSLSGSVDDGYFNGIPIGFDFWYMGTRYTTVSASTNGWLSLGADITNPEFTNNISTGGSPRPVIAPLWDDLSVVTATNVSYKTTGSNPNRIFTIQYLSTKWNYASGEAEISFQVKLIESTGVVQFIYSRLGNNTLSSASASIGISATATGSGNFLSLNSSGASPTVSSTSETTTINAKPATNQTYTFTPPVPTTPSGLSFTSVDESSMTLNWTDNSSNETGFVIYVSTDDITYSYVTKTAANATSSVQSGLIDNTTYYWRVYAVSEGGFSSVLSGNQATTPVQLEWHNTDWLYRKCITIDYTKVSGGPHVNFPMLISITDTDLQIYAQDDGDDILFTSSNGSTKLSHEIESYDNTTGTLVAWVTIPNLSSSANTVIYMYYGNNLASNQQNITGTWNSNYKGVWHLNGAFSDATSNANNGTNTGTTAATGMIAGGRGYDRSNGADYITITGLMGSPANSTLSGWGTLNSRDATGAHLINIGDYLSINVDDVIDGYLGAYYNGGWGLTKSSPKLNPAGSGWHYFVYTFDDASNTQSLYMDGLLVGSGAYSNSINYSGEGSNTVIGSHANGNSNYDFDGTIDEVRVSNSVRSAGWILTEYNNQYSPSTFYSIDTKTNYYKIFTGIGLFSSAARWGGVLPVAGDTLVIDGDCTFDNTAAELSYGLLKIGSLNNHSLTLSGTGTLSVTGIEIISNQCLISIESGTTLNNTGNLDGKNWATDFIINNSGTLTIGGSINDWIATGGDQMQLNNLDNSVLNIGDDVDNDVLLAASATGNTVNYTGNGVSGVNIETPVSNNYYHLTIEGTSNRLLLSNINIIGNLTIQNSAVLNSNSLDISIAGDWTNTSVDANPFVQGTGTVTFNGTGIQTITSTNFHDLEISNASGVNLNGNIYVDGILTLNTGILTTNAYFIDLGTTGSIVEATPSVTAPTSYVTGTVKVTRSLMQNVNNTFGGIGVEILETNKNNNSTEVIRTTGIACTGNGNTGITRYFTINPTDDSGLNGTMIFHYFNNEITGHTDTNLDIYKSTDNRVTWSRYTPTRDLVNNTLTLSNITSFSDWTASDGVSASLPIKLIDFDAFISGKNIEINWSTATEENNDFFALEKSINGITFITIATINGAGNSSVKHNYTYTDKTPYQNINYYRLKQTDYNGTFTYSPIITVTYTDFIAEKNIINVFPNPLSEGENLHIVLFTSKSVQIEIFNSAGVKIFTEDHKESDQSVLELDLEFYGFEKGEYFIKAIMENSTLTKTFIVK